MELNLLYSVNPMKNAEQIKFTLEFTIYLVSGLFQFNEDDFYIVQVNKEMLLIDNFSGIRNQQQDRKSSSFY